MILERNVYMFELVSLGVNIPAAVRRLSAVTCHMCHSHHHRPATNQMRSRPHTVMPAWLQSTD